jgi:hypothetical protein
MRLKTVVASLAMVLGFSGCSSDNMQTLPLKVPFDVSKAGYVYETDIYVKKPFFGATVGQIGISCESIYGSKGDTVKHLQRNALISGTYKVRLTITPLKNVTKPTEYNFFTKSPIRNSGDYHEYKSNKVETIGFVLDQSMINTFYYIFQDKGYYHIKAENLNSVQNPDQTVAKINIILPTKI